MNWYYESGGQQQGPVADSELDRLLAEGKISLDTLIWKDGMAAWTPLRTARPAGPAIPPPAASADAGWEVTRPAGSVSPAAPAANPTAGSDYPQPGWIRCTLTGRYFPPSEIIYLEGKPYSAAAKPQVVASLQGGGLLPTSETERQGPAWENRDQLGMVSAIWQTFKGVLFDPSATFTGMKRTGGVGTPWTFHFIAALVGGLFTLALVMIFVLPIVLSAIASANQNGAGMPTAMAGGVGLGIFLFYVVLIAVSAAITPFIGGGVIHLCLKLVGAARQPFETTFRTFAYCYGSAMLLLLVPVCGMMVSGIWAVVVLIIGCARTHEIPTGKAALGVLLPVAVCCILDVGLNILGAVLQASSRGN